MLNYYQPFLLPFLGFKRSKTPRGIFRSYYISFEDVLWNLLSTRGIPKQSAMLIPDFYCMDVVNNIRLHGYTPVFYPLDDHFQISKNKLNAYIKTSSPSVIILFHACGIQNNLLSDKQYIKQISKTSLILEDAVQRLINPETVNIASTNHVLIDSLRKTSPLNGSFIYSKKELRYSPKNPEIHYQLLTAMLFFIFRITLQAGTILKSRAIVSYAHKNILKIHDEIIGDSTEGHKGNHLTEFLHSFIQFSRVEKLKIEQTEYYSKCVFRKPFYAINIPESEYKHLHVFPIGIKNTFSFKPEELEKYLDSLGFSVWIKFPDCPWSKTRSVLFLPLGFHVGYNDIRQICNVLNQYTQSHYVSKNTK